MKVVIIEDEKLTAKDLARTLVSIDADIEVIAKLASVEEGLSFFEKNMPIDLIFSDIQLGDGISFDIFKQVQVDVPIIFCTAYNTYALQAFETAGIDYVLKPFSKQSIEKALFKFLSLKKQLNSNPVQQNYSSLVHALKQSIQPQQQSVIIHAGEKIIPLNAKDIALFLYENNYAFAVTFDGKKHILSQNMDTLEKMFAPQFFRANRQFLINRTAVKDAAHFFNRKLVINLTITFNEQIVVGKLKTTAFTNWLASQ